MPKVSELKITDDELRETIVDNQLKKMQERGSDLTIFSPRASFMAHHIGDFNVSSTWAAICNELCYRVAQLFPGQFHRRGDAAAIARRRSEDLHARTGKMRPRLRLRRHQSQSRSLRRALDLAAADRPALVSDLREDGGAGNPGDDPRLHQLQRLLPHHRRALSQRRHHRLHAMRQRRSVQGFPDAEIRHPAWRRRGAVSLGPVSRAGAGTEEAAAQGSPPEQHLLRHLRLSPARHRPA